MTYGGRPNAKKVIILLSDGVANVSIGKYPGSDYPTSHNVHTIAAYQEGQSCFDIADVYTIGLFGGLTGYPRTLDIARDTLQRAQNKGYYETTSGADLSEIYDEIAGQMGVPATNAVVTDRISDNFEFVGFVEPYENATYNSNTHTITWEPGTIRDSAQLTYKIRAKAGFQGGNDVSTNVSAKLEYTDVNGNNTSKDFPVPKVYVPEPFTVTGKEASIFIGDSVNLGEYLDVSGGYPAYRYLWTCPSDPSWRSDGSNPVVSPEKDTVYEVTVWDNYGCQKSGTVTVKVRTGTIIINKVVNNENTSKEFIVRVEGPGDRKWNISIKDGETKRIDGLWPGEYKISETVPMDYKLVSISKSEFEIVKDINEKQEVTVTNRRSNYGWFKSYDKIDNKLKVEPFADETPVGDGDGGGTVVTMFNLEAVLPEKQDEELPGETAADDNGEDSQ